MPLMSKYTPVLGLAQDAPAHHQAGVDGTEVRTSSPWDDAKQELALSPLVIALRPSLGRDDLL